MEMDLENKVISKVLLTVDTYKGNIEHFRNAVIEGQYAAGVNNSFTSTLIWKTFCVTNTLKINTWETRLNESRIVFQELTKRKDMYVPWWKLDDESPYFQKRPLSRLNSRKEAFEKDENPALYKKALKRVSLSNESEDPLSKHHCSEPKKEKKYDLDLLNTIIMDVERIFAGEKFLIPNSTESKTLKKDIIQLLYVWSRCNPSIGYKQGFHEIAGILYLEISRESVKMPTAEVLLKEDFSVLQLYNNKYLIHDLFTIFTKFVVQSGIANHFYEKEENLWSSIESLNSNLMKVDQVIHYNLISKLKLETQLWAIRFLRLIYLREINNLEATSYLWERLIAFQGTGSGGSLPELMTYITICLLIKIKHELVTSDFSEALFLLLHYPESTFQKKWGSGSFDELFKASLKLYKERHNDLQLYETGAYINEKWNPDMKIVLSYSHNQSSASKNSNALSHSPSPSTDTEQLRRQERMAFEKYRLEERLKRKAKLMVSSRSNV